MRHVSNQKRQQLALLLVDASTPNCYLCMLRLMERKKGKKINQETRITSGKQKSVGEQNNELVVVDLPKKKNKVKKIGFGQYKDTAEKKRNFSQDVMGWREGK